MNEFGWLDASVAYQSRLMKATDRAERLELLSHFPTFSVWEDVKREMVAAAEEIRRLRRRVEELENDAA